MARGQRRSLEEKIGEKEEIIKSLEIRVKKEKDELEAMIQNKQMRELSELKEIIGDDLSIQDLILAAKEKAASMEENGEC